MLWVFHWSLSTEQNIAFINIYISWQSYLTANIFIYSGIWWICKWDDNGVALVPHNLHLGTLNHSVYWVIEYPKKAILKVTMFSLYSLVRNY